MFVVGNNPFFAVKQFVHLLPAFFVFALHFGSNMDFFNFHIFGKFFNNFQKTRRAELQGKVNLFLRRPVQAAAVADNNGISMPISASTLAISLFKFLFSAFGQHPFHFI